MDDKLIERIDNWNKIKYPNDKEIRIVFTTLKPAIDYTIVWKDGTKTFQNQDGTVTTALKDKE